MNAVCALCGAVEGRTESRVDRLSCEHMWDLRPALAVSVPVINGDSPMSDKLLALIPWLDLIDRLAVKSGQSNLASSEMQDDLRSAAQLLEQYEHNPKGTARMLADLLNAIDIERLKDRAAVAKADGRKETSEHLQKIIDVIEGT